MAEENKMWVVVNRDGIITGASCDDGDADDVNFLLPIPKGSKLMHVNGPVRVSAHIDAPMVFPVVKTCDLPLFSDAVAKADEQPVSVHAR